MGVGLGLHSRFEDLSDEEHGNGTQGFSESRSGIDGRDACLGETRSIFSNGRKPH
jgi:hypothetical protein